MIAANNKIIVEVDYSQKETANIGGTNMLLGKQFSTNRRESNPVICRVIDGNNNVPRGTLLLVHHNRFVENSPHHLGENVFSLAYNKAIYAKINKDGGVTQLCGNIIVERIIENKSELIPPHLRKTNKHKFKVLQNGFGYKKGRYIYCYEHSDYEIVYIFGGKEHRVVKVYKDDIVADILPKLKLRGS